MAPPSEDPWDVWRKRHGAAPGDFPDFFREFEKEFTRMQSMVGKIMEDAMKHAAGPRRHEPFVYGFSMRVGPDGAPHLQPFGSSMPNVAEPQAELAREPLVDIQEGDQEVSLTVELPGVEKQDVSLHVAEEEVTVRVERGRRYHARVKLPARTEPSSAKATFKNGVLDVTLRKKPGASQGRRVSIE